MNSNSRTLRVRSLVLGGSASSFLAAAVVAATANSLPACSAKAPVTAAPEGGATSDAGVDFDVAVAPEGGATSDIDTGVNEHPPTTAQPDCRSDPNSWPMFGQNACNTASSPAGAGMSKQAAKALTKKWVYAAAGEVSATPAVEGGSVYVPDWGGMLTKLDAHTGAVTWSKSVTSLMAEGKASTLPGFLSRVTPVVTSDSVIFGTNRDGMSLFGMQGPSAFIMSIDKNTGAVKWITPVHDGHPAAVIAQSAVYDGTRVYVGVASSEEAFPHYIASYKCCTFRGSIVALDAKTGAIVWQTHTISDALYYGSDAGGDDGGALSGLSGVGVWGSTPVVDFKRKLLYVATGNNYSAPAGSPGTQQGDNLDAIMALDIETGSVKWSVSVPTNGRDDWSYLNLDLDASLSEGVDSDFGSGPNFFTAMVHGTPKDLVGAGQKSGVYYAVDPDTGTIVWKKQVGPGSHLGGIHWGTATDGNRVYVGVNNQLGTPYVLQGTGRHAGETVTTGIWSALDPATGDILWQTADPALAQPLNGVTINGPVAVVNGVMFGGSMDAAGTMFALDADNGDVLWSFKSGGTVYGGPAIAGGAVYWGSGYPVRIASYGKLGGGFGTSSKKLYAFAAP